MVNRKKSPEIISRYYEFLKWFMQRTAKFPRNHRYIFGKRLEDNALNILDNLIKAYYSKDKNPVLRDLNLDVESLRYHIRLANDLKLITIKQYEYTIKSLDDIGKQVGGWLKSLAK